MIDSALILGELGRAVFQEEGRLFMLAVEADEKPVPCRRGDLTLLLDSGVEVVELAGDRLSLASLRNDLHALHSRYRALSFALSGMDPDLSVETRSLCIDAAEELMQHDETRGFVRGRLLARQLPGSEEADIATALHEARMLEARHLTAVYEDVERLQQAIQSLLSSWSAASSEFFDLDDQATAEAERVLIDRGVFAGLVSALGSGKEGNLNSAVVHYSLDKDLNRLLPRCAFLLNSIRAHLKLHAALDPVKNATPKVSRGGTDTDPLVDVADETDPIRHMILGMDAGSKRGQGKKVNALEAKQKVDRQIEELNKALRFGNWSRFEDYLEDLVAFQIARSEPRHLGMTLCLLATSARDAGRLDLATRLVGYAYDLHIDDSVIWNTRAEILRAGGSLKEALIAYDMSTARFPTEVVAQNGRAEVLKAMGRLDEALVAYGETADRFPDNVVAQTGRAEVLKAMGRLDEALVAYGETADRFPDNAFARTGQAEVLKAMGRLDDALIVYQETAQRFPDNVVARSGRAEVLKAMGRLDEALIAYGETAERFPDNVVARNGRAEVLKALGRLDEALIAYGETAERFPSDVVARNGRAEVLKALGRLDEALVAYGETAERFPDNVVARNGRAEVLKALGRLDEALIAYVETAERFPDNAFARNGRAEVLKVMGRLDEALVAYGEIAEHFPSDVVARTGRAEVLKVLGRLDEALAAYEETAERFPSDMFARTGRATVLILLDRVTEARDLLAKSNPFSEQDWIGYHILAMSYLREQDYDEAANRLSYGAERAPWPHVRRYFETALAVALMRKQDYRQAAAILEKEVDAAEVARTQLCMVLLAHSQAELGRRAEALDNLIGASSSANPEVRKLTSGLRSYFGLGEAVAQSLVGSSWLQQEIEQTEFKLALAA